ncbi:MAG: CDP-alcohol phosphatidyltransferase family protein [Candidatus Binatia bacterium]|nr:CDP-alcohol phosphatidyltransferase family protein [Candidatus Binatia bacterium]
MTQLSGQPIAADVLTLGRVFAGPLFAWCVWQAERGSRAASFATAALFAFAAWSDIADGRWARRNPVGRTYGRWLDHGADIAFLTCAFVAYVLLGLVPWWVPASILCAFSAYVVRSRGGAEADEQHRMSNRIGHWGGVANYVLLGALIGNFSLGLRWLPDAFVHSLFLLVPLYSTAPLWIDWLQRDLYHRRRQL